MQTVQRLLLLLFAAFAALTVLQQIRYGMICGRSEQEDKQDDPKAKGVPSAKHDLRDRSRGQSDRQYHHRRTQQVKQKLSFRTAFCFEKCQVTAKIRCFTADFRVLY